VCDPGLVCGCLTQALRSYLSSANMSVWQQFVRNKDIRKNLTIAMSVKLQVYALARALSPGMRLSRVCGPPYPARLGRGGEAGRGNWAQGVGRGG